MSEPNKFPEQDPRPRRIWNIQRLVLLGLVIAVILSLFIFRKDISDVLHSASSETDIQEDDLGSRINFEPDSNNIYDVIGNRLAVLNNGTYHLYNLNGRAQIETQYISASPAMSTSDYGAVIYGRNEKSLVLAKSDAIAGTLEVSGGIVDACINDSGMTAVVHGDERYRSVVSVYNAGLELEYQWQTSEYYVLTAALSPDGSTLAVVALTQNNAVFISRVIFFKLDREEYYSYCDLTATMVTKISFGADNTLCAIGDDRVLFINTDGKIVQEYSYRGNKLSTFACDGSNCILVIIDQKSGLNSYLVCLSPERDAVEASCSDVRWVDIQDEYVALLYADSVEMRNMDLTPLSDRVEVRNVQKVFAVSGGLTLMIYSSQAGILDLIKPFQ